MLRRVIPAALLAATLLPAAAWTQTPAPTAGHQFARRWQLHHGTGPAAGARQNARLRTPGHLLRRRAQRLHRGAPAVRVQLGCRPRAQGARRACRRDAGRWRQAGGHLADAQRRLRRDRRGRDRPGDGHRHRRRGTLRQGTGPGSVSGEGRRRAPTPHRVCRREHPARDRRGRRRQPQHDRSDADVEGRRPDLPHRAAAGRPGDLDGVQRQHRHPRTAGDRPCAAPARRRSAGAMGRHGAV